MSGARARPSLQAQPAVNGVLVYRNGNPFFAGRRVVLREKGCSFDALLREATRGVRAPFGPVRNLYTPRAGHRVRRLEQVQSGASQLRGWGPGGLQEAQVRAGAAAQGALGGGPGDRQRGRDPAGRQWPSRAAFSAPSRPPRARTRPEG